jgi:uncharacterized protein YqeY
MSLEKQVSDDIKQAMLNKQKDVLEALRAIKSEFLLLKTGKAAGQEELPDSIAITALQKLIKQRKESADIYIQQNRQDLADAELFQAGVIEKYMPKQLSADEIAEVVKGIIAETGAAGMKDMGRVMGMATKKFAGQADNKVVSDLVKQLLSK